MGNPFLRRVQSAFGSLITHYGFRVVADSYNADNFGNAMVILEASNIRVRVLTDRGDVFVDVAGRLSPNDWHMLQRALQAITGRKDPSEGPLHLEEAAKLLDQNMALLDEGFTSECFANTKRRLDKLDALARSRLLQHLQRREN